MTKKEAVKLLRKELAKSICALPEDANYVGVSRFEDETHDNEDTDYVPHGHLFVIELIAEVEDDKKEGGAE